MTIQNVTLSKKKKKTSYLNAVKIFLIPFFVFIPIAIAEAKWYNPLSWLGTAVDVTIGNLFEWTATLLFGLTNMFFVLSSSLFDLAIGYSLKTSTFNIPAITNGFKAVLGVANLFFIFILLYIAIATILQLSNFDWKKTIAKLIVAALLINFSLFFTRLIIDVSNMFAVNFYNSMKYDEGDKSFYGPSSNLRNSFNFADMFFLPDKVTSATGETTEISNINKATIYLGGSIFQIIAGFVFLAGVFVFVKRTVILMFLLILSPIGFVGLVIPYTEKFAKSWWDALSNNALIAPVFLFMLYLVCVIVNGGLGLINTADNEGFAVMIVSGGEGNMSITLQFLVLIGLIYGALVISEKVCAGATKGAVSFAGKATGGILAGSSIIGRQTLGRVGGKILQNKRIQEFANTKGGGAWGSVKRKYGKGTMLVGDKMATSSWDARNIPMGNKTTLTDSLKKTGVDIGFDQNRGKDVGGFVGGSKKWKEWVDAGKIKRAQVYAGGTKAGAEKMADQYKEKASIIKEKKKDYEMAEKHYKDLAEKETDENKKTEYKQMMSEARKKASSYSTEDAGRYEGVAKGIMEPFIKEEKGKRKEAREETKEAQLTAQEDRLVEYTKSLKAHNTTYNIKVANTISNISPKEITTINLDDLTQGNTAQHLSARQISALTKKQEMSDSDLKKIQGALKDRAVSAPEDKQAEGALRHINKIMGTEDKKEDRDSGFVDQYGKPLASTLNS